ncbi:MAG: hypothetical protein HS111_14245 [Kofleriaceae bacterium]|nr:hypothetical protein [Kofleriaceae bacterium]
MIARGTGALAAALVAAGLAAPAAGAEPLRLRADALSGTPSPVGLLVLEGEASSTSG